jgi:hypothetical protein
MLYKPGKFVKMNYYFSISVVLNSINVSATVLFALQQYAIIKCGAPDC